MADTAIIDRPETDLSDGSNDDGDDGFNHIWHCDENLAMCGKDITGVPEVDPETDPDPVCVPCEAAWLAGFPCPAPECPRGQDGGEE